MGPKNMARVIVAFVDYKEKVIVTDLKGVRNAFTETGVNRQINLGLFFDKMPYLKAFSCENYVGFGMDF